MVNMSAAPKLKSLADLLTDVGTSRAELIDGQIVQKALPGGWHAAVEGAFLRLISQFAHKKKRKNGEGGWWILPEVSVHYRKTERVLTADLAGWRRDKVVDCPKEYPVGKCPDWVCEISHTTLKKDTTVVFETLLREGVPYYWIANVELENLQVFELVEGRYVLIHSLFKDDAWQRIKPFDSVELHMGMLFGEDDPNDLEEQMS
jgi:Uma2 family endonuclease